MKFDSYKLPTGALTVRPGRNGASSTRQMLREMTESTTLTSADGIAAVTFIGEYLTRELAAGRAVHIDGLGTFRVSLRVTREVSEERLTGNDVSLKRITFRATSALRRGVSSRMSHVRVERTLRNAMSPRHTADERRSMALALAREKNEFMAYDYILRTGISRTMAYRDLQLFVSQGTLSVRSMGKTRLYSVAA